MDSSFHEQESRTPQQTTKSLTRFLTRSFLSVQKLASMMQWLADLFHLTEEEREQAAIYVDRRDGE